MTIDDFTNKALRRAAIGLSAGILLAEAAGSGQYHDTGDLTDYLRLMAEGGITGAVIGAVPVLILRSMVYLSARAQGYRRS